MECPVKWRMAGKEGAERAGRAILDGGKGSTGLPREGGSSIGGQPGKGPSGTLGRPEELGAMYL